MLPVFFNARHKTIQPRAMDAMGMFQEMVVQIGDVHGAPLPGCCMNGLIYVLLDIQIQYLLR